MFGQTFIKKAPLWAFLVGLGLLGVGLAALSVAGSAHDSSPSVQRVRVMQAVADLQACLTCHTSPAELTQVVSNNILAAPHTHSADFVPVAISRPSPQVQTQLANLGERILAVSPEQADLAETAEREFLRLYDQMQVGGSSSLSLTDLRALAELVNLLEHQASPIRWERPPDSIPGPEKWAAVRVISSAPDWAAAQVHLIQLELRAGVRVCCTLPMIYVPAEAVFGIHHRGPPTLGQVNVV
jgi:hypothetical protein